MALRRAPAAVRKVQALMAVVGRNPNDDHYAAQELEGQVGSRWLVRTEAVAHLRRLEEALLRRGFRVDRATHRVAVRKLAQLGMPAELAAHTSRIRSEGFAFDRETATAAAHGFATAGAWDLLQGYLAEIEPNFSDNPQAVLYPVSDRLRKDGQRTTALRFLGAASRYLTPHRVAVLRLQLCDGPADLRATMEEHRSSFDPRSDTTGTFWAAAMSGCGSADAAERIFDVEMRQAACAEAPSAEGATVWTGTPWLMHHEAVVRAVAAAGETSRSLQRFAAACLEGHDSAALRIALVKGLAASPHPGALAAAAGVVDNSLQHACLRHPAMVLSLMHMHAARGNASEVVRLFEQCTLPSDDDAFLTHTAPCVERVYAMLDLALHTGAVLPLRDWATVMSVRLRTNPRRAWDTWKQHACKAADRLWSDRRLSKPPSDALEVLHCLRTALQVLSGLCAVERNAGVLPGSPEMRRHLQEAADIRGKALRYAEQHCPSYATAVHGKYVSVLASGGDLYALRTLFKRNPECITVEACREAIRVGSQTDLPLSLRQYVQSLAERALNRLGKASRVEKEGGKGKPGGEGPGRLRAAVGSCSPGLGGGGGGGGGGAADGWRRP